MTHLWEVDHPYYCEESNYFAAGDRQPISEYPSWAAFGDEDTNSDMDLNLLFRWDWKPTEYVDNEDLPAFHAKYDDNYRAYNLYLFWMGQRKGLYRCSIVQVCRADERAVIEFLQPRLNRLISLWVPLTPSFPEGDA